MPEDKKSDSIGLLAIKDLLKLSFWIPQYQRGYRWTRLQVEELLNDLQHFQQTKPDQQAFYCLQPIVVKQRDDESWELVDGQQRLTTICILMHYLRTVLPTAALPFELEYETREGSKKFLSGIDKTKRNDNVDYFHMVGALIAIEDWFSKQDPMEVAIEIYPSLVKHTKVIWYELNKKEDGHDVFARINSGKIPLTNAELVKALFLKGIPNGKAEVLTEFNRRQLEIAREWDIMEARLQQNDFWYFLTQDNDEPATRIDLLFSLLAGVGKGREQYSIFQHYQKKFTQATDKVILAEWQKVTELFQILESWFQDREWYHLTGYLIATGESINELAKKARNLKKPDFRAFLKEQIKTKVDGDWDNLSYRIKGDYEKLKRILLLFNIETLQKNTGAEARFPFHLYKGNGREKGAWSLEHIHAQKSDGLQGSDAYRNWLQDVRPLLNGQAVAIGEASLDEPGTGSAVDLAALADDLLNRKDIDKTSFDELQSLITKRFGAPEVHTMDNLALLAANDNSALGKGLFPLKRKRIMELEKKGSFIPIATRNVFLKYYTRDASHLNYWTADDREKYRDAIFSVLSDYRPQVAN